jgi:short-subunit dehydrogenase
VTTEKPKRKAAALITGATKGIGRAIAILFAQNDYDLILAARTEKDLVELQKLLELKHPNSKFLSVSCDVSDRKQVDILFKKAYDEFNSIDILICNAGIYSRGPAQDLDMDTMRAMMETNYFGALYCIYAVLPSMLAENRGHIVIMSSFDGVKGMPYESGYVASKHAITGFADVLRQETHGSGITTTTILPTRAKTDMTANISVPWIASKVSPEVIAKAVLRAIKTKKTTVFIPYPSLKTLYLINAVSSSLANYLIRVLGLAGRTK